jgi:hypothetical protein
VSARDQPKPEIVDVRYAADGSETWVIDDGLDFFSFRRKLCRNNTCLRKFVVRPEVEIDKRRQYCSKRCCDDVSSFVEFDRFPDRRETLTR